jgi:hypothetical protein
MSMAQVALPTISEEINRKAFETIDWLHTAVDRGHISKVQFGTGINALFMAVSGLVRQDIFDLITESSNVFVGTVSKESRHFISNTTVISLSWNYGDDFVRVTTREHGIKKRDGKRNFDNAADAKFWFGMYCEKLAKTTEEL